MRGLDRLWLVLVALSFAFLTPLWIALWWERAPLLGAAQAVLIGWRVWVWVTAPAPPDATAPASPPSPSRPLTRSDQDSR